MSSRCVTKPPSETWAGEMPLRSWWDPHGAVDNHPGVPQVCGALEVIHSLLKGSPAQEQLFAFLFEPGHVELLFSLLVQKKFSDEVRERVFKVGWIPSSHLLLSQQGCHSQVGSCCPTRSSTRC